MKKRRTFSTTSLNTIPFTICVLLTTFCSGCGSFYGRMYGPPTRVYTGVRVDTEFIANGSPGFIIDYPFSALVDTLLLPADLWSQVPTPNPLKGWKPDFTPRPSDKIIEKDYQDYIQKLSPKERKYVGPIYYFEDGAGQHAVRITTPINGTSWQHVLIYDKDNKRIKAIKYSSGGYRS